jgi:hypothetical protein
MPTEFLEVWIIFLFYILFFLTGCFYDLDKEKCHPKKSSCTEYKDVGSDSCDSSYNGVLTGLASFLFKKQFRYNLFLTNINKYIHN